MGAIPSNGTPRHRQSARLAPCGTIQFSMPIFQEKSPQNHLRAIGIECGSRVVVNGNGGKDSNKSKWWIWWVSSLIYLWQCHSSEASQPVSGGGWWLSRYACVYVSRNTPSPGWCWYHRCHRIQSSSAVIANVFVIIVSGLLFEWVCVCVLFAGQQRQGQGQEPVHRWKYVNLLWHHPIYSVPVAKRLTPCLPTIIIADGTFVCYLQGLPQTIPGRRNQKENHREWTDFATSVKFWWLVRSGRCVVVAAVC